jgi:outer membrane protein OmpA-like peptidoglycan-associated protein
MRGILIAVVLGVTALTFYSALWFKSEIIERDITDRVTANLNETGAEDIGIDVDGRHVTLSGVVYDAEAEAAHLETADATYGALGPIDGLTYLQDGGYILASKTESGITLQGTVPDEDTRAALLASAGEATDGAVEDQLVISGPAADWQNEASFGLGQLAGLSTGTVTAAAGAFALSGVADGDAGAVRDAVAGRDGWQAFVSSPQVTDNLSNEVARLSGNVAAQGDEISGLQADISELTSENAGLTQERDALGVELEELRASMTEGETDVAALREQLGAAQADVETRDATIADLTGQVSDAEGALAALRGEADGMTNQIAELETELANRQSALGSTDEQVAALNLSVGQLNDGLASRDAQIADLTEVVAARDTTIEGLNAEVAETQGQVETLTATVAERDATIEALNGTVAETQGQVETLTAQVAERDTTIEALNGDVADAQAEVDALAGRFATVEAQVSTLQADVQDRDTTIQDRDTTIAALRNQTPASSNIASNTAQCAAQASSVMEGTQINFQTATATIEDGSVEVLERLTGIALACVGEGVTVEVGGHTDNQGSDANNQALSEARAQAVVAFMAERGVPTDGLQAVGYGEGQPIADNGTAEGRAQNRRISFDWQTR